MESVEAPSLSMEVLFGPDTELARSLLLIWVNDFAESVGFDKDLLIAKEKLDRFLAQLQVLKTQFPAKGGFEKASPFKKVAAIYTLLHECEVFVDTELGVGNGAGISLYEVSKSPVSFVGLAMAQHCLDGAALHCADGNEKVLSNRIDFSDHFCWDLIEASRGITMSGHFKLISLLFESLSYQANPSASYPQQFNQEIDWSKAPSNWFDESFPE